MADRKYGRLFTEEDVLRLMARYGECVSGRAVASVNRALGGAEPRTSVEDLERELGRFVEEFDGDFPADEPLFLLRGQDKALAVWQGSHPDRVKVPD